MFFNILKCFQFQRTIIDFIQKTNNANRTHKISETVPSTLPRKLTKQTKSYQQSSKTFNSTKTVSVISEKCALTYTHRELFNYTPTKRTHRIDQQSRHCYNTSEKNKALLTLITSWVI